jgi:hypothetical protein
LARFTPTRAAEAEASAQSQIPLARATKPGRRAALLRFTEIGEAGRKSCLAIGPRLPVEDDGFDETVSNETIA